MAQDTRTVAEATIIVTGWGGRGIAPYSLKCAVESLAEAFGEKAVWHRSDILTAIATLPPETPGAYLVRLEEQYQEGWRVNEAVNPNECSITILHRGQIMGTVRLVDARNMSPDQEEEAILFFSF